MRIEGYNGHRHPTYTELGRMVLSGKHCEACMDEFEPEDLTWSQVSLPQYDIVKDTTILKPMLALCCDECAEWWVTAQSE